VRGREYACIQDLVLHLRTKTVMAEVSIFHRPSTDQSYDLDSIDTLSFHDTDLPIHWFHPFVLRIQAFRMHTDRSKEIDRSSTPAHPFHILCSVIRRSVGRC